MHYFLSPSVAASECARSDGLSSLKAASSPWGEPNLVQGDGFVGTTMAWTTSMKTTSSMRKRAQMKQAAMMKARRRYEWCV